MSRILIGKFKDITNTNTYYVKIGNNMGQPFYINDYDDGTDEQICFSGDDPIVIENDMSDTFENVYIRQASINFISNFDIRSIVVADNYTDIPVEIRKDLTDDIPLSTLRDDSNSIVIFTGYVIPLSFNQSFSTTWNEFTLDCVDQLGILEYVKFPPLLNSNYDYNTPLYFIHLCLNQCRKRVTYIDQRYNMLSSTWINPQIFIGDSEDDWMTCKDVLNEIGKIYGFYFYQDGDSIHVENILLYDLDNPVTIQKEDYIDNDTNISVDPAYNSIKYSVDLSNIDENFIDPFKDEYIKNTSWRGERILSEISYKYNDKYENMVNFKYLVDRAQLMTNPANNNDWSNYIGTPDSNAFVYDHYGQILENTLFDFGEHSYLTDGHGNSTDQGQNGNYHVRDTLAWLYQHPGKGAFVSFGSTDNLLEQKNKRAAQLKDMQKMLLIQVNGPRTNEQFVNIFGTTLQQQITSNEPVCSFSINSAASLVPNDKNTTNYLVINGKLRLNPIVPFTGPLGNWSGDYDITHYNDLAAKNQYEMNYNNLSLLKWYWDNIYFVGVSKKTALYYNVVNPDQNEDAKGKASYLGILGWINTPEFDIEHLEYKLWPYNQYADMPTYTQQNPQIPTRFALPYLKLGYQKYKYFGTSIDNGSDNIWRIPILACELKIGNKYLVEDLSITETFGWQVPYLQFLNRYSWKTYEECPEKDGVKQTWFTIGVNPGVDDFILGKEYEFEDNVTIDMNIKANGIAIPIPYSSQLNGRVEFKILGPYNSTFRLQGAQYNIYWQFASILNWELQPNERSILALTENIQLTDLSLNLYSGNQNSGYGSDDNDLVYISNISQNYIEDKEQDLKFCTTLTNQQAQDKQIDYKPNNSSIMTTSGDPWYGMNQYEGYNANNDDEKKVKLEEARVYEQYNMWNRPRHIVETTLKLVSPQNAYLKTNYIFDYFKYDATHYHIYRTIARTINLKMNSMTCKMKEFSDEPEL